MEHFVESLQQSANNNSKELNEVKEDQKVFGKLGEQLLQQMKKQQEVIEKLSQRLEQTEKKDNEKTPRNQTNRNALKHLCPNCKQQVFHKEANCPETNIAKRWPGWTSQL